MPEMPAFLANFLEPKFARPAVVERVEELAPKLRRVRLIGSALGRAAFRPGQEVELRVSERAFRHYTPSAYDVGSAALELVFYLHGRGPGSSWAESLVEGTHTNVLGPGGGLFLANASTHVLLGDETTLGLFACLARTDPKNCRGAIEVDPANEAYPSLVGLALPSVARTRAGDAGSGLLRWLEGASLRPSDGTHVYLAGHAGTIVRLRAKLLELGFSRRQLHARAYWADGKKGL